MPFEEIVLSVAKPRLQEGERAYFFNGTLFLECAEQTSRSVFSDIFVKISSMIKVSRVGEEFAIDFV